MRETYFYSAYGLIIKSPIDLPHFFKVEPLQEDIEIHIVREKTASTSNVAIESIQEKNHGIEWKIPNLAFYTCIAGRVLRIEPYSENWDLIKSKVYAHLLAILLIQQGKFVFHSASVIDTQGKLWVLFGDHRSGKTHLSLKLIEMGYTLFSDDVLRIEAEQNRIVGYASFPVIGIREKTLENQQIFSRKEARESLLEKGRFNVNFHPGFNPGPLEIGGMVFIQNEEDNEIQKTSSLEALVEIQKRASMGKVIPLLKKEKEFFQLISCICSKIPAYRLSKAIKKGQKESGTEVILNQLIKNFLT